MADHSKIEWTDATWTPIRARRQHAIDSAWYKTGWHCEHVSEGCRNCYAESFNQRLGTGLDFKPGHRKDIEIFLDEKMLLAPLRRKKSKMIFVCSMTDLFADFVQDEWIDRIFAVMARCPQHRFQVLTKRAKRMREYCSDDSLQDRLTDLWAQDDPDKATWSLMLPLTNVWLGISAEDQANWDERKEHLRNTPTALRFASFEPLLGPIVDEDFSRTIQWAIVGLESGPNARPRHPDLVRSIRDQCASAGVPFFFKQWGTWLTGEPGEEDYLIAFQDGSDFANVSNGADIMLDAACEHRGAPDHLWKNYWASGDGHLLKRVGKKRAGRLLDGELYDGMPT